MILEVTVCVRNRRLSLEKKIVRNKGRSIGEKLRRKYACIHTRKCQQTWPARYKPTMLTCCFLSGDVLWLIVPACIQAGCPQSPPHRSRESSGQAQLRCSQCSVGEHAGRKNSVCPWEPRKGIGWLIPQAASVHIYVFMYVCMYVMWKCAYIYIYICIYICMYVCMLCI